MNVLHQAGTMPHPYSRACALLAALLLATLGSTVRATPQAASGGSATSTGGAAGSAPAAASAAVLPVGQLLRVKVTSGPTKPGTAAKGALLHVGTFKIDSDAKGEREIPNLPTGTVDLMVLVAGAPPCKLALNLSGAKPAKVHVFVPKAGAGGCEVLP